MMNIDRICHRHFLIVTDSPATGRVHQSPNRCSDCSPCSGILKIFSVRTVRCSCCSLEMSCSACSVFGLFAYNQLFGVRFVRCSFTYTVRTVRRSVSAARTVEQRTPTVRCSVDPADRFCHQDMSPGSLSSISENLHRSNCSIKNSRPS